MHAHRCSTPELLAHRCFYLWLETKVSAPCGLDMTGSVQIRSDLTDRTGSSDRIGWTSQPLPAIPPPPSPNQNKNIGAVRSHSAASNRFVLYPFVAFVHPRAMDPLASNPLISTTFARQMLLVMRRFQSDVHVQAYSILS